MMAAITHTTIHILARVGDSEVINEIGTFEVDTAWRLVSTEDDRAAVEASHVIDVDLPAALREMADEIERRNLDD